MEEAEQDLIAIVVKYVEEKCQRLYEDEIPSLIASVKETMTTLLTTRAEEKVNEEEVSKAMSDLEECLKSFE